ncbi:hypothetical protein FGE12_01570 [Aggregicoccus sp. 17bor-14]|uniref:hypothetical protein n=1 Tax=Myxococcaceae TaxID=31 RepID=UPI00129C4FD8|nr:MULTISPECIES: hypothetical protein [Myxococcaceae]MBF5041065.1 hypothetical protein [Simulacricoccus sp. 17bor-14]MRI86851.1 hypothetical protein [Aggregicoccus sp. 17bor-14]
MSRSLLPALLLLASLGAGCGDTQVRHYLVAVDAAPLSRLEASCYKGGVLPAERPRDNGFQALRWTLWDADGGRAYLELESPPGGWVLGDAPVIQAPGAIAGTGEVFEAERLDLDANDQKLRSRVVRVTFTERGALARGTLELSASDTAGVKCAATLAFTARDEPRED